MKVTTTVKLDNLTGIQKRLQRMQHFYEGAGELMVNSIMKNFEEQGRPTRWKPLAAATLLGGAGYGGQRFTQKKSAIKEFQRHLQGKQILISRGMLRNSIKKEATSAHALVGPSGNSLKYAALQNFGGMAGRGHKVFIPERRYILAQAEDHAQLQLNLRRWVMVGQ